MLDNSQNAHQIEPELRAAAPRKARWTLWTQIGRFLGIGFCLGLATLFTTIATNDIRDLTALQRSGKLIATKVVNKYVRSGKTPSYCIDYEYRHASDRYDDTMFVSEAVYEDTTIGSSVLVTYLPSQPQIHREGTVTPARVDLEIRNWAIGIGAGVLVLGLMIVASERCFHDRLRLLRNGTPVAATITKVETPTGKSQAGMLSVSYSYVAGGQTITQRVSLESRLAKPLQPGASITVLYDPSRPKFSQPYMAITEAVLSRE